jgi:hypothetical protein
MVMTVWLGTINEGDYEDCDIFAEGVYIKKYKLLYRVLRRRIISRFPNFLSSINMVGCMAEKDIYPRRIKSVWRKKLSAPYPSTARDPGWDHFSTETGN